MTTNKQAPTLTPIYSKRVTRLLKELRWLRDQAIQPPRQFPPQPYSPGAFIRISEVDLRMIAQSSLIRQIDEQILLIQTTAIPKGYSYFNGQTTITID